MSMIRSSKFTAETAFPGLQLRPQRLQAPDHRVLSVERVDDSHVKIVTTQGKWVMANKEMLEFPRRDDGSIHNWAEKQDRPPFVGQLAVGDILPPWAGNPAPSSEGVPPEMYERLITEWRSRCQRVTAVHSRGSTVNVYLHSRGEAPAYYPKREGESESQAERRQDAAARRGVSRFITVGLAEPIIFPRHRNPAQPPSIVANRRYRGHGPYVPVVNHQDVPGKYLWLAEHPSGRGRWPRVLEFGIDIAPGHRVLKPQKDEWDTVRFVGKDPFKRHPKDPQFGISAGEPAAPNLVELEITYDEYFRG